MAVLNESHVAVLIEDIDRLHRALEQKDAEMEHKDTEIKAKDAEIEKKDVEIKAKEAQIEALEQEDAKKSARIEALENERALARCPECERARRDWWSV